MRSLIVCFTIVFCCVAPLAAQDMNPRDYYYQYMDQVGKLRAQYPITTDEGRKGFAEAMAPVRKAMNDFLAKTDLNSLPEDQLFFCGKVAFYAANNVKEVEVWKKYLERFPRGIFLDLVKRSLYERYTLMDGKVAEAKEMLPGLEAAESTSFFKLLIYMTWALDNAGMDQESLDMYRRIVDETVHRAGREKLPAFYLGHSLPAAFAKFEKMGKQEEALKLLDQTIPVLDSAPDIQGQLKSIRNSLVVMNTKAPTIAVDRWVNGKPVNMADLKGKVVVLDFWATWCVPCRKVYPELNALKAQFKGDDLVVLGLTRYYGRYGTQAKLSTDQEAGSIATDYAKTWNLTWPLGIAADDGLFRAYGVTGLPTVFIIDKKGTIRERIIGTPEDHHEKLFSTVQALLKE